MSDRLASAAPIGPPLGRAMSVRRVVISVAPVLAALAVGGLMLLALGVDPFGYYAFVVTRGLLRPSGLQESLTRMAPMLLLGASLIVSFRASVWNLGTDGQFLLGAVASAALAPALADRLAPWLVLLACMALSMAVAAAWSLLPALLRAYQGVNDVISTLMMNVVATSLCALLVKLAFRDPRGSDPATTLIPVAARLPRFFGTSVNAGLPIAVILLIVVHVVIGRTSWGLRLRILGLNPRAARHVGFDVPRMIVAVFMISGALAGLAGSIDVIGAMGLMRADYAPNYGLLVVPLVFLARLDGRLVIVFVFAFAVLSIGGQSAAIRLGVPQYFNLLLVGLVLVFLALADHLDLAHRRRTR